MEIEKEKVEELAKRQAPTLETLESFITSVPKLRNTEQYKMAAEALVLVREEVKGAKSDLDDIVKPIKTSVKKLEALLRPSFDRAKAVEGALKAALVEYRKNVARMQGEAVAAGRMELARTISAPPVEGVQVRSKLVCEVTDVDKLPDEYKEQLPDLVALKAAARKAEGDPGIPGFTAYYDESIAVVGVK